MISVLILTLDEEVNIADCLDSVAWADDVLVLDSGSDDGTVEIAEAKGARVVHRPFDTFARQRNYGLRAGNLAHDWVLHLDADERVTPALRDALHTAARREDGHAAYRLPSKLIFRGRWLKHAGMYPTYQVRFGRKDALTFTQAGHGQRSTLPDAQTGTIDEPLLHYAFAKGLSDWFERHNRYSTDEARRALRLRQEGGLDWGGLVAADVQRRRRALKDLSYRLPLRPLLRFLYVYIGRLGILDGRAGLTYSTMLAVYEYMVSLKIDELERGASDDAPSPNTAPDASAPDAARDDVPAGPASASE
jgi:glycosyltransferase involved in cell wall biosynthesis